MYTPPLCPPSVALITHAPLHIPKVCLKTIAATPLRNNVIRFFLHVCLCVRSCEASDPSRGLGSVQRRLEVFHLLQVNHAAQDDKLSWSPGLADTPADL